MLEVKDRNLEISAPIIIRSFKIEDIYATMYLITRIFNERYDADFIKSLYESWNEGFLIAEYKGSPIGILIAVLSDRTTARILVLGIEDSYRNSGIGTRMMNEFIRVCAINGMKKITLEVRVSNKSAIRFYNRFGFDITDYIHNYYNDGEDGYVMVKLF